MAPNKLILIRTLPGSGKTTRAKQLAEDSPNMVHVETDMYFQTEGGYVFDRAQLSAAHTWCQWKAAKALEDGHSVVVSNTFVKHWEMLPYLKMADALQIPVEIVVCDGKYQNVHGVPSDVIERMQHNWEA